MSAVYITTQLLPLTGQASTMCSMSSMQRSSGRLGQLLVTTNELRM